MSNTDSDPTVQPGDSPEEDLLAALWDEGEFRVDVSADGDHAASNGLAVDTPAGRLEFEVYPIRDTGANHARHDPDAGVCVNKWSFGAYVVLHVHDTGTDEHWVRVRPIEVVDRIAALRSHGVPDRRAEVVALRERGLTYSDIVDATGDRGPNHRGDVSKHLQAFNEQVENATWLAANADAVDMGR
ncbi:hypothetical protein [Halobacterium jilantaiense]|uniref:Uncharacterized protein n=1 Tax=Halobacterium jilantaiense TaxID=355548 RepID=A0A1I0NXS9_9EURY|nr:hypothetical protein [Halobacterium jilantaiense]SEW06566.1 hypothetical protein SAMN04487945_1231 [Halobacterium jilantaiense]